VGRALVEGWKGIAASIPLILMAASVRHIVVQGGIMDTILHWASRPFSQASPFIAVLAMYGLTLIAGLTQLADTLSEFATNFTNWHEFYFFLFV